MDNLKPFLVFFSLSMVAPFAWADPAPLSFELKDYEDEIERDYILRSGGSLQVTNMRGDIVVQGWSFDKIRVKARRKARAVSLEEARRLFAAVDFRFNSSEGNIELGAEYGRGLSLQERLREREKPHTGMEMTVYAPAYLKLNVWGVSGHMTIKNWDAPVETRSASGTVQIEGIKSGGASVLCPSCSIQIRSVNGSVRCMGGKGPVVLSNVDGPQIYIESNSGPVKAEKVRGEQLYVTESASLTGRELSGRIEFHGQEGPVEIIESVGFLSGRTTLGTITARMREWKFADKAVIESTKGDIRLSLPRDFTGDVDLYSLRGKTEIGFNVVSAHLASRGSGGVDLSVNTLGRRVQGQVGMGGELLKIYSVQGNIKVLPAGSAR